MNADDNAQEISLDSARNSDKADSKGGFIPLRQKSHRAFGNLRWLGLDHIPRLELVSLTDLIKDNNCLKKGPF